MSVQVLAGDMREVLARLISDGAKVSSIVTDPPYHLTANKKGGSGVASINLASPYGRSRIGTGNGAGGFMGQRWDGGDIAFQPETWRLCWELLPPGGYLLAFSGTRTYHRMVCAIEDAGFEIRDTIAWLYGSGFPKSHNVAKGIDKAAGRELEIMPKGAPVKRMIPGADQAKHGWEKNNGREYQPGEYVPSEEAAPWDGWGTALKPALEPICVARKPLDGTVAANVLAHGAGALNIDGCRVGLSDGDDPRLGGNGDWSTAKMAKSAYGEFAGGRTGSSPLGRWPANVVHDGSEEVLAAFPASDGAQRAVGPQFKPKTGTAVYGDYGPRPHVEPRGDSGSAARFFFQSKPDALKCCLCCVNFAASPSPHDETDLANIAPSDARATPSQGSAASGNLPSDIASDAESGSPVCPPPNAAIAQPSVETWEPSRIVQNVLAAADLCASCATDIARALAEVRQTGSEALSRFKPSMSDSRRTILHRSLASYVASRESTDIILTTPSLKELFGSVSHAIAESINSARSAASIGSGSKRLFYSAKADHSDRLGSKHPTVKPVDLMRWLVRLVTPKGGIVLDPFAGSGTTGMACMAEGLDCILVEREAQYVEDIRRRIAHVRGDDTPLFGGS